MNSYSTVLQYKSTGATVSSAADLIFELSGSSSLKARQVNSYFSRGIAQQLAPFRPHFYYYLFS